MDPTPSSKHEHVFAIVRADDFHSADTPVCVRVTVKKVVFTEERARQEVDRLNALRSADDGVEYFWQVTRLERCPAEQQERGT
ncbi:MAG: hypothetical protein D6731_25630 [Planctomycetota bacterium]|nr:MAG: hypothetical protein D6731_25630 [Planctomycetota bacterium]